MSTQNIDVNYKNKKRYNTARYPIRQPIFIVWLIWILSKIALLGKKYNNEPSISIGIAYSGFFM